MAPTKKTAAPKKPAVKKPAAKAATTKAAVKKPAVKKPAAKAPAAKKTAAKAAATKAAVKKPVPAKPAVKKPAAKIDDAKFRNLFDAYAQDKLPLAQGYIVSSFFDEKSAYSIYEIVSYAGVKEIYLAGSGLTFVTGGKKLYVLVEPDTYRLKHQDPVHRADGERIPKRFNELEIITAKNQSKVMIAKEPDESYGSFTIMKPMGLNFSVVFYELPDMYKTVYDFFLNTLNRQRKVPEADAKKAAQQIVKTVEKYMGFKGDFE